MLSSKLTVICAFSTSLLLPIGATYERKIYPVSKLHNTNLCIHGKAGLHAEREKEREKERKREREREREREKEEEKGQEKEYRARLICRFVRLLSLHF
jgi:hypothetical protein